MPVKTRITALSLLDQLADELITEYDTGAAGKTITAIITDLLAMQVHSSPITKGTIDPTATRAVKITNDTILKALLRLRDTVGGYIYVDTNRALQWENSLGEDKGQQIRYRKNLLGISKVSDYTKLVNKLYAYGAGEYSAGGTDTRIKLSDAEGQSEDYIEDAASQAAYGIVPRVIVDKSITDPDTLLAWAELYLADHKTPYYTYRIDSVDLSASTEHDYSFEALQLGSTVKVIDEELGIDIGTTVVKIKHPDLAYPQNMQIELANKTSDLTDKLTEVYDVQMLNNHVATIISAGQVIVKGIFTVLDWATDGETTIKGGVIETDSVSLNTLTATGDIQSANYVANMTGWKINAATGSAEFHDVKVRGSIYTSSIIAGQTLTVSGTISAGAGSVLISVSGITIKDEYLTFKQGATKVGVIKGYSSALYLASEAAKAIYLISGGGIALTTSGYNITISAGSGAEVVILGNLRPNTDNAFTLGTSLKKWSSLYVYGTAYVGYLNVSNSVSSKLGPSLNNTHDLGSSTYKWRHLYLAGRVGNHWLPYTTTTYDLGSSTYKWNHGYINYLHFSYVYNSVVPDVTNTYNIGSGSYKWNTVYRTNEAGCPLPTSNSASDIIKKIKSPQVAKGDYGERHYFQNRDFPDEMKFINDRGKLDIEMTRTLGVCVQAIRELVDKVEALEGGQN